MIQAQVRPFEMAHNVYYVNQNPGAGTKGSKAPEKPGRHQQGSGGLVYSEGAPLAIGPCGPVEEEGTPGEFKPPGAGSRDLRKVPGRSA